MTGRISGFPLRPMNDPEATLWAAPHDLPVAASARVPGAVPDPAAAPVPAPEPRFPCAA